MTNISQNIVHSLKVLVPFTRNYAKEMHASEISRVLSFPQRTAARKLEVLQKAHLLNYKKVGKNKSFFFDLNLVSSFSLLEMVECYKEIVFLLKYPQIGLLLNELATDQSILLFGSYAKEKAKENSDVDLVIFARKTSKIKEIITRYPFEVNVHYITISWFEKRLKAGWPLAKEIAMDHILFGEKEKVIKSLINYYKK
ncbi:MAG: nucleotidyltransferase domain-containing protein [Nanoarchaeota archaeon]